MAQRSPSVRKGRRRDRGPRGRGRWPGRGAVALVALLAVLGTSALAPAYPRPGRTERVSLASDGAQSDAYSQLPVISGDGRFVAFLSYGSNLVPNDTNSTSDVFVHDRQTGVTERVSVATDGTEGDRESGATGGLAISLDGRHVAFGSEASNLVPGDTNGVLDVFVHDRETGVTERVSVATEGTEGDNYSQLPAISGDGRHVAFASYAANLVPGDTNEAWDIFVHDRQTGVTERVSVASDGAEGNDLSQWPAISADGRHVAFMSIASNLVDGDLNQTMDIFVHDRETGVTERVSVASDGTEGNGVSAAPVISADGRHVAFMSSAPNLVPAKTNHCEPLELPCRDVFVHDRETGVTERVSVASDGTEGNDTSGSTGALAISPDGRFVGFESWASNLVPGDTNQTMDVFLRDRETGVTERVSVASDGTQADLLSALVSISTGGRHVAFGSSASNLVPGDTNATADIFLRDRGPSLGVGGLTATPGTDALEVSGWATFSGAVAALAEDPADDGLAGARELGAEITAARITHRPELEDLLLRMDLASLPGLSPGACAPPPYFLLCPGRSTGAGAPGVLYRWSFEVASSAYEVRALRAAATVDPATTDPFFALYRCAPSCEETVPLTGGIGTTGTDVRISVPMNALGAKQGTELTDITASAVLGEASPGALEVLDEVELPNAAIRIPRVELGIAPASTPESGVTFDTEASLTDGTFSGTVGVSSLPAGDYRVWARACLGEACGAHSVHVTL